MSDFWSAVLGGIVSPVAVVATLMMFRDKLLDHFLAARMAKVNERMAEQLETHRGGIATAIETLKSDLNRELESHKTVLQRETRQLESSIKRTEESYLAAIQFGATVDLDLRKARIAAYEPLWKKTAILPRWPRAKDVTYRKLVEFSADMRNWYFETGGIYLSEHSMAAYSELQEKIWSVLEPIEEKDLDRSVQGSEARDLSGHYDSIRLKCSKLRTRLTNDILSRREAPAQAQDDVPR